MARKSKKSKGSSSSDEMNPQDQTEGFIEEHDGATSDQESLPTDHVDDLKDAADRYGPDGDLTQNADAAEEALNQFNDEQFEGDRPEIDLDDLPESADGVVVPPPVKVKSGRGLAWFSMLLALAGLGGAGYLYYELIHLQPLDRVSTEVNTAIAAVKQTVAQSSSDNNAINDERIDELRSALTALERKQGSAMTKLVEAQQEQLQSTERGLIESLNKVANEAPPSEQEWRVAEVEYLLRIANHRVLMEGDAAGALHLLTTADNILAEMDDFGMHNVRAQLADEMLSLKRIKSADLQGLFLRLEALKRELGELPLQVPEFTAPSGSKGGSKGGSLGEPGEEVASTAENLWNSLTAKFDTYVQFRRLETKVKPLLSPDETMYLELNLRLMLERAQLAALRREQEVYEQSLASAQDWLQDYLDPESSEVNAVVKEIDSLLDVQLKQDLPDVSGSLRSLLSTERGTS